MSTVTMTLNGSALTGLTTAGGTVPSKAYTISDTDLQSLLNWAATFTPGASPTNQQIFLQWIQSILANPTIAGVQQFATTVTIPPPISMS